MRRPHKDALQVRALEGVLGLWGRPGDAEDAGLRGLSLSSDVKFHAFVTIRNTRLGWTSLWEDDQRHPCSGEVNAFL